MYHVTLAVESTLVDHDHRHVDQLYKLLLIFISKDDTYGYKYIFSQEIYCFHAT